MNSYIITKSITPKIKNEDYIESFKNEKLGIKGFIVGDGIGSHFKPSEGSEFCVKTLKSYIENCSAIEELNLTHFYTKVYNDLKNEFTDNEKDNLEIDKTQSYGTTLICVIELEEKFIISYLGNGSIWHIRGNFYDFSPQRYLPWNAINVLNPHTVEENGKEALYKFIALECTENQLKPSILEISKDNELYGDIILASTDGLFSNDHNPIAKDREGNLWISGDKKIELLLSTLKKSLQDNSIEEVNINANIDEYLNQITENKLIDDDTSFGIIIPSKSTTITQE
ncbi:hypothetical protein FFWV33_19180 [Flavobacterium faecale]|uniref:PPM-type phosphatase domain-containing protein n=1 Tax=Flavobacterium faecale TaxID=1355330 RepID=A0A2S1LI90_9FLAO|nr:protein phosphatase 2C domain-containing protein [Flavobacterium faecale]AWG23505.1 hypothetical protein FFWV33_19180 [Flavobacterium faecale]